MEKGWKSVAIILTNSSPTNTVLFDWGHLLWYELSYFALCCNRRGYTYTTSSCCSSCCRFGTRHTRVSRCWASLSSLHQLHCGMDSCDVHVQVCGRTCSYFLFTVNAFCSAIPGIFKLLPDTALFMDVSHIYVFLHSPPQHCLQSHSLTEGTDRWSTWPSRLSILFSHNGISSRDWPQGRDAANQNKVLPWAEPSHKRNKNKMGASSHFMCWLFCFTTKHRLLDQWYTWHTTNCFQINSHHMVNIKIQQIKHF